MCLKIVEKNQHKDVHIKEGEVSTEYAEVCAFTINTPQCYLHPSRIPHSPQRFENTVGLVIERERTKDESDGLRYGIMPVYVAYMHDYPLPVNQH